MTELLHAFLDARLASAAGDVAVVSDERELTFRDLATRRDALAAHLRDVGVTGGSRVALFLDRSPELVVAIFAVLSCGAACVPLDPDDPAPRRARILAAAHADVVVTQSSLLGRLGDPGVPVVRADGDGAPREPHRPVEVDPGDTAFLFFTSGSTGQPKGVVLSHRALASGQEWLQRTFRLTRDDAQLLRTTASVTNLVREVFWPVLAGARIVLLPPGAHRDVKAHVETMLRHRVSVVLAVPALLRGLIEVPDLAERCTSLRYVFSSSDTLPGDLPERFFATGLTAELYNVYGLTEALYAGYWRCAPGARYTARVPIGHPAELSLHVLDGDGREAPAGAPGELYLGGVGIADGYLDRPDLTAERFAPGYEPGTRLFRTGDLAVRRPDGAYEMLGRGDAQLKVLGHRVEPGEVESHLRRHPSVADAVVVGREDLAGHTRLVAYVVASGAVPDVEDLRAFLQDALPEHMVPSVFALTPRIPLTHNGKLDVAALTASDAEFVELSAPYVEPRNSAETLVAAAWADVLGVERVGAHDNFFALGGDSILGFLVSTRLNRHGYPLPVTQVFATPTVAEMAAVLPGAAGGTPAVDAPGADWSVFGWDADDIDRIRRVIATSTPDGVLT